MTLSEESLHLNKTLGKKYSTFITIFGSSLQHQRRMLEFKVDRTGHL